mmetsp:Transcript_53120/g.93683  ORF Transcript_53120/g.93683 Transcript_53120/m.93683 type:complete len:84 (-) Transcript_53120:275-526(-)
MCLLKLHNRQRVSLLACVPPHMLLLEFHVLLFVSLAQGQVTLFHELELLFCSFSECSLKLEAISLASNSSSCARKAATLWDSA